MFKKFKRPKIKLSSVFLARALCKFCQKSPTIYYNYKNEKLYKSPALAFRHRRIHTINLEPMYDYMSKYNEYTLNDFKFPVIISTFNIKWHRCRQISNLTNYEEALFCECGKTCWIFNYKSTQDRKEISMRKSLKTFDRKSIY